MTAQTHNIPRWFKSQPIKLQTSKVNREDGIIHDVVMCQAGPAKGHGIHLEEEFIADLVAYDQQNFSNQGLKCRFGHPSMSDTTMGTQMGVFKNFRQRGTSAIADLHLLNVANLSPKYPKMREWMLGMAEERPDFVMMSIVFSSAGYYQKDEEGNKVYCWYDEDGQWVPNQSKFGNVYAEFGEKGEHYYTDAVESGAATESLFSTQFNQDKFAVQAVSWLQDRPDILQFLQNNPNKLVEFAHTCGIDLPKQKLSLKEKAFELRDWLFGNSDVDLMEGLEPDVTLQITNEEHLEEETEAFIEMQAEAADWRHQAIENKNALISAEDRIVELESQIAQARGIIEELESMPAADETTGELETELGPRKKKAFESNPVTAKARQWYENKNKG